MYHLSRNISIPVYIGDGSCDDNLNTKTCNYDGGDCCLNEKILDLTFCIECFCHIDESHHNNYPHNHLSDIPIIKGLDLTLFYTSTTYVFVDLASLRSLSIHEVVASVTNMSLCIHNSYLI